MANDHHETATGFNVSRYFVEHRHISWVLFAGVLAWGVGAYRAMPKRKDPDIPVRQVAVATPWPGQSAERVEQLVTRKIEEKLAQNIKVSEIKSRSRAGLSVVYAEVDDRVTDTAKEFDDIKIKLDSLTDLPQGAGPVQYIKEFGETSALMLTVASPRADGAQLELLANAVEEKIDRASVNIVLCGTGALDYSFLREAAELMSSQIRAQFQVTPMLADGNGFVLITGIPAGAGLPRAIARLWDGLPQRADLHPDVWDPIVIAPGAQVPQALRENAGAKYSYRELDDFTERIERAVRGTPEVSRVTRVGLLEEQVELLYSQDRIAGYGIVPGAIPATLEKRNTTIPAGTLARARFRRRSRPPPPFTASNTTTAIFTIVGDVVVIDVIVIVVITTITPSWRCRLHRDHAATSSPVGAPQKPQFTCIRTANSSAPTGPKWWVAHLSRRPVVLFRISCGRPKRWTHRLY